MALLEEMSLVVGFVCPESPLQAQGLCSFRCLRNQNENSQFPLQHGYLYAAMFSTMMVMN